MGTFLRVAVSGVALGSISALVALGFLVTYKADGRDQLRAGWPGDACRFLGFLVVAQVGYFWWLGYPSGADADVPRRGARRAHRPCAAARAPELVVVIATLGVGLVISAILLEAYGTEPAPCPRCSPARS